MNTLRIHRFNGTEEFSIETAECFTVEEDDGIRLWFEVETGGKTASGCPDTSEFNGSPNAELGILMSEIDLADLAGREFRHAGTVDDDEDSCESIFYYFEHQPLRDNQVVVLSQTDGQVRVRWTARTHDVNYYDGSKPDARIEIECDFELGR